MPSIQWVQHNYSDDDDDDDGDDDYNRGRFAYRRLVRVSVFYFNARRAVWPP